MNTDPVLLDVEEGVARLTLNRPERLNAWTRPLQARYYELLQRCAADPDVRAIVLTGAGRAFCAGADSSMMQESVEGAPPLDSAGTPQWILAETPKPVIAAINGACAGIGLVQALYCDVRFAARGAKFTTAFTRRGLIAEHGVSWVLPRIVGQAHAMDLLLSARAVDSGEALSMGLVNRVYEPDELLDAAMEYARELARKCSPFAMAHTKRQVLRDALRDLPTAALDSDELLKNCVREPDFAEGVQSFVEKRLPAFPPLRPDWQDADPTG